MADSNNTNHEQREHQDITTDGGSIGVYGDISNSVVSRDFIVNLITGSIGPQTPQNNDPDNVGIRRSQTADAKGHGLLVAAQQGRVDVVRQLLEDGANWKYTEPNDQTALFKAANAGHLEVVELLLSVKERQSYFVNHPERQFLDTPLHRAAVNGRARIARLLLSYHPSIEAIQRDGFTPIQLAAAKGSTEILKMLLEEGANIYHEANLRQTALHVAAKNGQLNALKVLLEKDSSTDFIERRNKFGDTPLFLAVLHKHADCARLLIDYGASIHVTNNDKANILHISVRNQMPVFLKEQLPKFSIAEITAKNQLGNTPLDVAYNQQRPMCIDILKARLEKG